MEILVGAEDVKRLRRGPEPCYCKHWQCRLHTYYIMYKQYEFHLKFRF